MSDSVKVYAAVGIGGMLGAAGRYSISLIPFAGTFPFATLTVNLLGCFLLTFLYHQSQIKERLSATVFTAIGTGVIGSFTTFSTFSVETIQLAKINLLWCVTYVVISILGGLLFCYIGYKLASKEGGSPA